MFDTAVLTWILNLSSIVEPCCRSIFHVWPIHNDTMVYQQWHTQSVPKNMTPHKSSFSTAPQPLLGSKFSINAVACCHWNYISHLTFHHQNTDPMCSHPNSDAAQCRAVKCVCRASAAPSVYHSFFRSQPHVNMLSSLHIYKDWSAMTVK